MSINPARWAAETFARRWPTNPHGAFYMIAYGASPAMADEVINGGFNLGELLAENVDLHTKSEMLSRGNKSLRRTIARHADELTAINAHLHEARRKNKKLRARINTFETFFGMPIADAAEAILVAEELALAIRNQCSQGRAHEIANRFMKLRNPPTPKMAYKSESYLCPECGGPVTRRVVQSVKPRYFCPANGCLWEGEAI